MAGSTASKGDPDTAMSAEEFEAKFHLLAGASLDAERREAIVAAVAGLPATDDCRSLFEQLFRRETGTVGAA